MTTWRSRGPGVWTRQMFTPIPRMPLLSALLRLARGRIDEALDACQTAGGKGLAINCRTQIDKTVLQSRGTCLLGLAHFECKVLGDGQGFPAFGSIHVGPPSRRVSSYVTARRGRTAQDFLFERGCAGPKHPSHCHGNAPHVRVRGPDRSRTADNAAAADWALSGSVRP
jgi:hypothetical protein